MGWFTSGSSCSGDMKFECTYEEVNPRDIFNPAVATISRSTCLTPPAR